MKVLFCNIAYMNQYIGKIEDDQPQNGGSWVKKHNDAHEKWNFLNYNGYCYGFVMNNGEKFSIERIDPSCARQDKIEGVTVVWCALKENNQTVIVGWYENATVYRYYQESIFTPAFGIERSYFTSAKAEDCYLLPENLRKFTIGRAVEEGKGKGFGRQNYWYAESAYAQTELIPEVLKYFESVKSERMNRIESDFEVPTDYNVTLTDKETEQAEEYLNSEEYYAYLPLGYRRYYSDKNADDAYNIAYSLSQLYQFDSAIKWYKTVIELEGTSWDTNSKLPYLYQQCEQYQESIDSCLELLEYPEAEDGAVRDELYSVLADNYNWLGKISEGIGWLDKIIAESKNDELVSHTKEVKKNWLTLM